MSANRSLLSPTHRMCHTPSTRRSLVGTRAIMVRRNRGYHGEVRTMLDTPPVTPGRIFISYRQQDSAYPAGWLYDRLAERFGNGQVFKDVDSIGLGADFVEVITNAVASCEVLLAV